MENSRVFLSQLMDSEIYHISGDKNKDVVQPEQNTDLVHEKKIEYQGSNSSGVIVIVQETISETDVELLDKVLTSVNLSRDRIALIYFKDNLEDNISQMSNITSSKIISFGITSGKSRLLDIQAKYSPTSVEKKTVVLADTLSDINEDIQLKRQLWNCLKEIF